MSKPFRNTDEEFISAVTEATSYRQVMVALGYAGPTGGGLTTVKRRVESLGLDVGHFNPTRVGLPSRNPNFRKGVCRKPLNDTLKNDPLSSKRVKPKTLRMAMLNAGLEHQCAGCALGNAWQGSVLTLEVHHVDGDWRNNGIDNLQFLCPNCHSQTPGHNIKKGKPSSANG